MVCRIAIGVQSNWVAYSFPALDGNLPAARFFAASATAPSAFQRASPDCLPALPACLFDFHGSNQKKKPPDWVAYSFFGDPDGNRTRDAAVKGRSLNRLTTGPEVNIKNPPQGGEFVKW